MLKPGGRLFLSTPNGRYFVFDHPRFSECPDPSVYESVQFKPNSDGHIFLTDVDECGLLAGRAGLYVERVALSTNTLTCGHKKMGISFPFYPDLWPSESSRQRVSYRRHCATAFILNS